MTKAIDKMDKDELLDRTAVLGIEADYTMSSKKLREILKNYVAPTKEVVKGTIMSERQRQEKIRTQF